MKIVIATDNFLPRSDGIASFLDDILPHLKDHEITIIAPDFNGEYEADENINVIRVPLSWVKIGDYQTAKKPKQDILKHIDDADVVFTQTIGPIGSSTICYAKKLEKNIIAYVHSLEWILVEKSLSRFNVLRSVAALLTKSHARKIYNKCTALMVPSNDVGEILSAIGIKQSKYVVRLGIDTHRFKPENKKEAKNKLGIPKDNFVVGYVGRIAREKNLSTLKKAFKRLHGKDNTLLIVGDGIESIKKDLEGENVILAGKQNDVVPYLNAMDVFVMPSLTETTCLAALEAMACEVPVIGTKVGSLRTYVHNKKNGFLFPKSKDTFLGIKLTYIKEHEDKRIDMGKEARETVLKDYSFTNMTKQIKSVLEVFKPSK